MSKRIYIGQNSFTIPSIYPTNFKKLKSTQKDWYIQYYYYSPEFPKGKYKIFKEGINKIKDVELRKEYIIELRESIENILAGGFDPINKQTIVSENRVIRPNQYWLEAMRTACNLIKGSKKHTHEVELMLDRAEKVIPVDQKYILIKDLKRAHIKETLERMDLSDFRFNRFREYFSQLISEIIQYDCIEYNFVREIKKRKVIKTEREVISDADFEHVKKILQTKNPAFYRYLMIFYYSGSRSAELLNLQVKDINLSESEYKVTIMKGKKPFETTKVILKPALPYWEELLELATNKEDYIFSKGLVPGAQNIQAYQITKRWYRIIKKPLEITADFYSLKHKFLDELDTKFEGANLSMYHAAHLSENMTNKVYLQTKKKRANEALKNLDI